MRIGNSQRDLPWSYDYLEGVPQIDEECQRVLGASNGCHEGPEPSKRLQQRITATIKAACKEIRRRKEGRGQKPDDPDRLSMREEQMVSTMPRRWEPGA